MRLRPHPELRQQPPPRGGCARRGGPRRMPVHPRPRPQAQRRPPVRRRCACHGTPVRPGPYGEGRHHCYAGTRLPLHLAGRSEAKRAGPLQTWRKLRRQAAHHRCQRKWLAGHTSQAGRAWPPCCHGQPGRAAPGTRRQRPPPHQRRPGAGAGLAGGRQRPAARQPCSLQRAQRYRPPRQRAGQRRTAGQPNRGRSRGRPLQAGPAQAQRQGHGRAGPRAGRERAGGGLGRRYPRAPRYARCCGGSIRDTMLRQRRAQRGGYASALGKPPAPRGGAPRPAAQRAQQRERRWARPPERGPCGPRPAWRRATAYS